MNNGWVIRDAFRAPFVESAVSILAQKGDV